MLIDNHGRKINYLRLAVTDRCNLRCFYCMPADGLNWLSRKELMTYEEMLRICSVLIKMGIQKIRITGGEPFIRKDMMPFLSALSKLQGLQELTLTTNGILTAPLVPELKKLGLKSVNLSLDTLDRNRFYSITRRDELPAVMETFEQLLKHGIQVKLNAVVMNGKNTEDIIPLVELTKDKSISVRFIEEMPFNGEGNHSTNLKWDHIQILETIKEKYPDIQKKSDPPFSTAYHYQVPGYNGNVGIIAAYSRTFCGTCNRIRITPQGILKTCLYDNGVINMRDLMRSGLLDEELQTTLANAISQRFENGWDAEKNRDVNNPIHESMAAIGG